jgi:hypothetical protein
MIVAVAAAVKDYIETSPVGQFPGDFVFNQDVRTGESNLEMIIRKAVLQSMPNGEDGESDSDSGDILEEDDNVDPSGNKFVDDEAEEEDDDEESEEEEAPKPKKRKSEASSSNDAKKSKVTDAESDDEASLSDDDEEEGESDDEDDEEEGEEEDGDQ